ncbi:MAG: aminopeptidase N [Gammaproteobacteria bacterium]|nr:aminopeptidase N [Gammaproteobacteria bacterium]
MSQDTPTTIYLKNYTPPAYLLDAVELRFELNEEYTTVAATLKVRRNPDTVEKNPPLILEGQEVVLESLILNDEELSENRYRVEAERLVIENVPAAFTLNTKTRIKPQENTSLEGLYRSNGMFCTQCEAEGFRRITYFPDRPDVMTGFTTTIVADQRRYPVLLSNGNPIASGELANHRHWVRWEDPFPKPSYLFALVAGDLVEIEDHFITASGRNVALRIFVEPANADKCDHAMRSLKQAMAWDEQTFGLEYDLDIYMIVAVGHFNMGAMENKGLNIFNSKYVLARPDTATDMDYQYIQGVIGHEYFHNWTGNRVTCRDWFQLSLKEGLTVFRDQEFSAAMTSRAVKRINDVRYLRTAQFAEDSGPMAHPVRPDSYIEINNFYTLTVYEKGAEVIRMLHTLLGKENFRRGMDLYFQRHDGQAVTADDFILAMQDAAGVDLNQFRRWYSQAGTPTLTVNFEYDENRRSFFLRIRQESPPTPGQPKKEPLHIPLTIGLLDQDGNDLPLRLEGEPVIDGETSRILQLTEPEHEFRFLQVPHQPIPSLLRSFSAPVKLKADYSDEELAFLMAHDSNEFNRWDAGQQLAERTILAQVEALRTGVDVPIPQNFLDAFGAILANTSLDKELASEALTLPTEGYLAEQMEIVDVDGIHQARKLVLCTLATSVSETLINVYQTNRQAESNNIDPESMGRRRLANLALGYLMELGNPQAHDACVQQFRTAANMTDCIGALGLLVNMDSPEREGCLESFYSRWKDDPLVVDKWFSIQATSRLPNTLSTVHDLMRHPAFDLKNPNRVRSLIGAFSYGNQVRFHGISGAGYSFLADRVLDLDPLNPQVAARLLGAMSRWNRFDEERRRQMHAQLDRIVTTQPLSKDVYEVAHKSLGI